MKRQIARTISILSLFVVLSVGAVNVSASGGSCSLPSCRPNQAFAQDPGGRETVATAQPEDSFSLAFLLAQWALNFPYVI